MDHDQHEPLLPARRFWRSRYAIGLLAFAAMALFFLLSEHRAHAVGALPYLLLAVAPFLHIFMHGGHGHGHGGADDEKGHSNDRADAPTAPRGRSRTAHHHH